MSLLHALAAHCFDDALGSCAPSLAHSVSGDEQIKMRSHIAPFTLRKGLPIRVHDIYIYTHTPNALVNLAHEGFSLGSVAPRMSAGRKLFGCWETLELLMGRQAEA